MCSALSQVPYIFCLILTTTLLGNKCSVQFSHSVVSDSLWPHELQHARPLCPSLSTWVLRLVSIDSVIPSNHLIPVAPFSSCPQSFPASGSFPMSQFFASGGQSTGVSASASVFPMSMQDWFPLGLTDLISLLSKGLSRVFSNTTRCSKASILRGSAFFMVW